jgi:hypothetical protein
MKQNKLKFFFVMRSLSMFLTFFFVNLSFCLVTSTYGLSVVNSIYNPNRYIPESLKWSRRLKAKVGDQSVGGTLILGGQEYYISPKESDLLLKKLKLMKDVNVHVPFPTRDSLQWQPRSTFYGLV